MKNPVSIEENQAKKRKIGDLGSTNNNESMNSSLDLNIDQIVDPVNLSTNQSPTAEKSRLNSSTLSEESLDYDLGVRQQDIEQSVIEYRNNNQVSGVNSLRDYVKELEKLIREADEKKRLIQNEKSRKILLKAQEQEEEKYEQEIQKIIEKQKEENVRLDAELLFIKSENDEILDNIEKTKNKTQAVIKLLEREKVPHAIYSLPEKPVDKTLLKANTPQIQNTSPSLQLT